jgi:hypothetical protein
VRNGSSVGTGDPQQDDVLSHVEIDHRLSERDDRVAGLVSQHPPVRAAGARPVRRQVEHTTPAVSMVRARSNAVSGVSPAGSSTTGAPAASAGITFTTTWRSGRFKGVMAAKTPTG